MRRQRDALLFELHWSAEPDPTTIQAILVLPIAADRGNLIEHPFAATLAVRRVRRTVPHGITFENCHAELGAADIDGERAHSRAAAKTSEGLAVPVPGFIMVMDAIKF